MRTVICSHFLRLKVDTGTVRVWGETKTNNVMLLMTTS